MCPASSPWAISAQGSIKRVAASVGEGAQVVAALHLHFAERDRLSTSSTRITSG